MGALTDYLFLSEPGTPFDAYINANSPRIGINNFANKGNVSSTIGTIPTNPAYLATLPSTDEKWISEDRPSHIFIFNAGDSLIVDYVGIAAYRGLIGRQIQITLLLNSQVVRTIGPFMVTEEVPVFKIFEATECDSATINFSGADSFDIEVGFISIGQTVALPRNIYVGHSPMPFSRRPETRFLISDNGTFLGQQKQRTLMSSSVSMSNVPPDYYREIIYPFFQLPAETMPFFWAWRPGTYPDEVAFCWLPTGQFNMANELPNGFMNIGFDLMGHVNEY